MECTLLFDILSDLIELLPGLECVFVVWGTVASICWLHSFCCAERRQSNRLQMAKRRDGVVSCTYLGPCVWRNRRIATGVCPSLFATGAYIKQAQWPNEFGQRSAFYCTELLHYIDVTGQLLRNSILFPFFCPYQFFPVVPFTSQCSFSRNRNLLLCLFRETEPVLKRVGRNSNFLFLFSCRFISHLICLWLPWTRCRLLGHKWATGFLI
jgi:hypothetical protein